MDTFHFKSKGQCRNKCKNYALENYFITPPPPPPTHAQHNTPLPPPSPHTHKKHHLLSLREVFYIQTGKGWISLFAMLPSLKLGAEMGDAGYNLPPPPPKKMFSVVLSFIRPSFHPQHMQSLNEIHETL